MRLTPALAALLIPMLAFVSTARCEEPDADQKPAAAKAKPVFNGKDLTGWKVIDKNDFEKHGKVFVKDGELHLETGEPATGVTLAAAPPRIDYELSLEAKRTAGSDFFCGVTFPVNDDYLSLIVGGWGGGVTGISNLDDMSAVENETTGYTEFEKNQWYAVRLRVTKAKVEAWIDKKQIVDVELKGRKLGIWWEQEAARPLGIVSWNTSAVLRNIQLRKIPAQQPPK